jgi:hypothetical protein
MEREEEGRTTADLAGRAEEDESSLEVSLEDELHGRAREEAAAEERGEEEEEEALEPLLPGDRGDRYRSRWRELQSRFVDEPRETVEQADRLVADLMQELAGSFADTRAALEEQWTRGDDVSTEDLRVALQRYRSFFERLLAA